MSKLKKRTIEYYSFYCPGCKHEHSYHITSDGSGWSFNQNMELPTFTPSLLNRNQVVNAETNLLEDLSRCHLFVTNGKIEYCSDSTHEYAGKSIELREI